MMMEKEATTSQSNHLNRTFDCASRNRRISETRSCKTLLSKMCYIKLNFSWSEELQRNWAVWRLFLLYSSRRAWWVNWGAVRLRKSSASFSFLLLINDAVIHLENVSLKHAYVLFYAVSERRCLAICVHVWSGFGDCPIRSEFDEKRFVPSAKHRENYNASTIAFFKISKLFV